MMVERASQQGMCFDRAVDISIDITDRLSTAIGPLSELTDRCGCCVIMIGDERASQLEEASIKQSVSSNIVALFDRNIEY